MTNGLDALVRSLLHEGYALCANAPDPGEDAPSFGAVHPPEWALGRDGARDHVRLECVLRAPATAQLDVSARFLQESGEAAPLERVVAMPPSTPAALAREVAATFVFGDLHGRIRARTEPIDGPVGDLTRLSVHLENTTEIDRDRARRMAREDALPLSLLCTHFVLRLARGRFVSPFESDGADGAAARACHSESVWPVLAAPDGAALLGAPLPLSSDLALDARGLLDATDVEEALLVHAGALTGAERDALAALDGAGETETEGVER